MKRNIKVAALLFFVMIVPGGTILAMIGAACGIGGLGTVRQQAVEIKKSISSFGVKRQKGVAPRVPTF